MLSFPAQNWQKIPKSHFAQTLDSIAKRKGVASLILPRLYLSDYYTAIDEKELQKLGITHVISVIEHVPDIPKHIPDDNKLHLSLADRTNVDMLGPGHLERTTEFIHSALTENDTNKVLVHCFQGISRSATVVCAYLVAKQDKGAEESITFLQAQRGIVCPNLGFRKQLEQYAILVAPKRVKAAENSMLARISGSMMGRFRHGKAVTVTEMVEVAPKATAMAPEAAAVAPEAAAATSEAVAVALEVAAVAPETVAVALPIAEADKTTLTVVKPS